MAREYLVGQNVATFKVDADRNVVDLVGELVEGRDDPVFKAIYEPLIGVLPEKAWKMPKAVEKEVGKMIASQPERLKALRELRTELEANPEIVISKLNGKAIARDIAKIIVAIRQGYAFRTGDWEAVFGKKEEEFTTQEVEEVSTTEDITKSFSDALQKTFGVGQGGGEGLSFTDPAFELKMFAIATKRVYEQLAGVERQTQSFEERCDLVRQTCVWFVSNQLLRRYLPTLINEAGGTFEVATAVGKMMSGWQKVSEAYEKLKPMLSGTLEEVGSIGKEMPDSVEFESLLHNFGVEFRVLMENGQEKLVNYSLQRMMDFYMGNFGESQTVGELNVPEVRKLLKQYDVFLKARYGDNFDAWETYRKYFRVSHYRTDLRVNDDHMPKGLQKHVGDTFSETERKFVEEIVLGEVWLSRENDYGLYQESALGLNSAEGVVGRGELIIPWFIDDRPNNITNIKETERFRRDVTALPLFAGHQDPRLGPLLPMWELYTRHLSDSEDKGADAYMFWEFMNAGVDMDKVVAVELPRFRDGSTREMAIEVNGKRGAPNKMEMGLLSSGGLAWLGSEEWTMYEILRDKQDKALYDSEGNLVLAPKRDRAGEFIYEQDVDEEGNLLFDDKNEPIYKVRKDGTGKPVRDEDGNVLYQPKLDGKGREMFEPVRDDNGNVLFVTPRQFLIHNVAAARLSPIWQATKGSLAALGFQDGDPVNAGQFMLKAMLKGLEWRVYTWFYGIAHPYYQDMFVGMKDDLYYRKRGSHAMFLGGKGEKAKNAVVRKFNSMRLGDDEDYTLEPYSFHANNDDRVVLVEKSIPLSDYQQLETQRLLEARRRLPMDVGNEYVKLNHLYLLSEKLWADKMGQLMPGQTIVGVRERVVAEYGASGRRVDLLTRANRGLSKEDREAKKLLLGEIDLELKRRFAGVSSAVEDELLDFARSYQDKELESLKDGVLSPAGRIRSRREILLDLFGWSSEKAGHMDTVEMGAHLESIGVNLNRMPAWMRRGRTAYIKWAQQMSIGLSDMGDVRDLFPADWEYNGKEGEIQQKVLFPLFTSLIRADEGHEKAVIFGADKPDVKDLQDLGYKLIKLLQHGLQREAIMKYQEELTELVSKSGPAMSYRQAEEQREITSHRTIYAGDMIYPTPRRVRFKLKRGDQMLPELNAGAQLAETGRPGDMRLLLEMECGTRGLGVGPHQILERVVHATGDGVVFYPSSSKGKPVLLPPSLGLAFQIWGRVNEMNELELDELITDVLGIYGHRPPMLTSAIDGKGPRKSRVKFMEWLAQSVADKSGLTVERVKEIAALSNVG